MVNYLIVLFLLTSSGCGKIVNISMKKLESSSRLSDSKTSATDQEGTLIRGKKDQITSSSSTHNVSIYSSYSALEFIAKKPLQSQHPVKYRGKIKDNEIILEVIEDKK